MTTEQVERSFDVVWEGRDYLCVFLPPLPREAYERMLPAATREDIQDRQGQNKRRVLAAMPGTSVELETRTGLSDRAVQAVLNSWRRKGHLVSTRPRGQLTVYRVVPEGRP